MATSKLSWLDDVWMATRRGDRAGREAKQSIHLHCINLELDGSDNTTTTKQDELFQKTDKSHECKTKTERTNIHQDLSIDRTRVRQHRTKDHLAMKRTYSLRYVVLQMQASRKKRGNWEVARQTISANAKEKAITRERLHASGEE